MLQHLQFKNSFSFFFTLNIKKKKKWLQNMSLSPFEPAFAYKLKFRNKIFTFLIWKQNKKLNKNSWNKKYFTSYYWWDYVDQFPMNFKLYFHISWNNYWFSSSSNKVPCSRLSITQFGNPFIIIYIRMRNKKPLKKEAVQIWQAEQWSEHN